MWEVGAREKRYFLQDSPDRENRICKNTDTQENTAPLENCKSEMAKNCMRRKWCQTTQIT